ncbi:MAG: SDR family oxidoreductase [Saprospiraceae bacterium]|nr:SDR family oxidoreductase [Saprospiraceae bacterium]
MYEKNEFKDKVAIITGATSGMGKQVAHDLATEGARIIASGRNIEEGKQLEATYPEHIVFIAGDIKDVQSNEYLVEMALKHFGRLDHVVLSAGQLGIGRLDQLSVEDWRDTFATNTDAVFYLLRKALPIMQEHGGSVVIIGSIAAFHAFPNHPAYCASKGALIALVRQLALDFGPKIRINLVCPAQVKTPLLEASAQAFENPDEILQQTANRLPLKRLGTSEDIAASVLFLLSERSSWVTGSYFVIDGGFLST